MIKINLNPVRSETETKISWIAPILAVNNEPFNLSLLEDGATASGHPVLGDVTRVGNDYQCTVVLGHGKNAPQTTRFPEPLTIAQDGIIELPLYDAVTALEVSHV